MEFCRWRWKSIWAKTCSRLLRRIATSALKFLPSDQLVLYHNVASRSLFYFNIFNNSNFVTFAVRDVGGLWRTICDVRLDWSTLGRRRIVLCHREYHYSFIVLLASFWTRRDQWIGRGLGGINSIDDSESTKSSHLLCGTEQRITWIKAAKALSIGSRCPWSQKNSFVLSFPSFS